MSDTFKLLLSLSLSGSILALSIFALKPLIRHKLSKSVQYFIWIIVLFRFIIPFSFEGSVMNELFYNDKIHPVTGAQTTSKPNVDDGRITTYLSGVTEFQDNITDDVSDGKDDPVAKLKELFDRYVLLIWFLGIIVVLMVNLTGYIRFIKCVKSTNRRGSDEQNAVLAHMLNGRYNLKLYYNSFVTTPMLVGLIKPCIIIPDTGFTEKQLKNILRHEVSHLKHFDIAVKWLTMIAVSIHWFNPFIYLIRKEINNICELACDEAVIKNLSAEEKQDYGDTLIDMAAKDKYPSGVLQATMCEEKRSLKERLTSIMRYGKRSKAIIILSLVLFISVVTGALFLGAGVGKGSNTPPNIYISAENEKTKTALVGTYTWNSINSDSIDPLNIKYKSDNTVNVSSGQQLVISTQKIKLDRKFDFELNRLTVYKDGKKIEFQSPDPFVTDRVLYVQVPIDAGEYIYEVSLRFEGKGQVSYYFVVRVDMVTFDLYWISKFKTKYVGDSSKVSQLVQNLPLPDKDFYQRFISMVTDKKPYKLTVFYEPVYDEMNVREWPAISTGEPAYLNLQKNALVLFCMIDNVDEITFAFRNSPSGEKLDEAKYDSKFTFNRADFQNKYGDLTTLGRYIDVLRSTLEGRITGLNVGQETNTPQKREFTDEEIQAAIKVVEGYFRAIKAKDDKAILKTLTQIYNRPDVVLYGEETRTLISAKYKTDDPMRDSYVNHGRGRLNGIKKENVIVIKVNFNVKYPEGIYGSYNEGDYTDWNMILVRKDKNSPWLIDDQGV